MTPCTRMEAASSVVAVSLKLQRGCSGLGYRSSIPAAKYVRGRAGAGAIPVAGAAGGLVTADGGTPGINADRPRPRPRFFVSAIIEALRPLAASYLSGRPRSTCD